MKPRHYYQVSSDTEVGRSLGAFMDKCAEASEQARRWALAQGASFYYESPNGMAGGIVAVGFDNTLAKEGWERVDTQDPAPPALFVPTVGSELEKEMAALPVVSEMELITILVLQPLVMKDGSFLPMTFGNMTPCVFKYHDHWYMDVPYESRSDDMQKISETQFHKRLEAVAKKR